MSSEPRLLRRGLCAGSWVWRRQLEPVLVAFARFTQKLTRFVLRVVPDVYLFQSDQEEPDLVSALWGLCVSIEESPCLMPPRPGSARAGWAARCWPGPGGERGAGRASVGHMVPSSGSQTREWQGRLGAGSNGQEVAGRGLP